MPATEAPFTKKSLSKLLAALNLHFLLKKLFEENVKFDDQKCESDKENQQIALRWDITVKTTGTKHHNTIRTPIMLKTCFYFLYFCTVTSWSHLVLSLSFLY